MGLDGGLRIRHRTPAPGRGGPGRADRVAGLAAATEPTGRAVVQLRPRLVEFAGQMLDGAVRRSDQRAKGESYVRGLLTDGARKSMQPMAERLGVVE